MIKGFSFQIKLFHYLITIDNRFRLLVVISIVQISNNIYNNNNVIIYIYIYSCKDNVT